VLGTLEFMSPEQARGKPVDKRTDIWAFGCVLFEMLSGTRPFAGETPSDVIAAVLTAEPEWRAPPPDTPPRIRVVRTRVLTKDPRRRLRDMGDARIEIDHEREKGKPAGPAAAPPLRRRRKTLPVTLAAAALIGAAIAAWLAFRPSRRSFTARGPAAAPPPVSLAIPPLPDLSRQHEGQMFGAGFSETVGARLARSPGLQVVTAYALTGLAEKQSDPYRIAAAVGAGLVVSGSFQRADDRIRITFSLFNAREKRQIAVDQ